jgi:hypothetical protein
MGIAIPQVITPSKASGAQIIDGSLKFNQGKTQHLTRTPSSDGNKRTWTWSGWVKPAADALGDASGSALFAAYSDSNYRDVLRFGGTGTDSVNFQHRRNGTNYGGYTDAKLRDYGGAGWYHVVLAWNDGATIYVNGVEQSLSAESGGLTDANNGQINNDRIHYIGARSSSGSAETAWDGQMSQIYFVDGQELDASYFGFTDPLTNTWKPKKYTNTTTTALPVTEAPTLSNGALIIKAEDASIAGTITSASGNLNYYTSSNGVDWTRQGSGTSYTFTAAKYLAAGGSGTQNRTFVPSPNENYSYHVWNDNTNFDVGTDTTADVTGKTFIDADKSNFGLNGFYLPFDGNSPIGQDKSGRGNDWTPVNFGGSVELDSPIVSGAKPSLNATQGGTQAGVGVFGSSENKVITVTVASKTGGGNAYFFDGVERDSLALIRGTTIRFDTTDSSNDSHPFKLSSTNADSSGGTEYTDGVAYFVNGSAKNGTAYVSQYSGHSSGFRGIKWTVPHNVSTTYYYCTVHTGMGEDGRLTSTTDETKADKFAWKCFFALPCVGPNKDLSSVINQKSGGKALTVSGASASSVETHFYNKSIYFDGSNDNIKTESTSHFLSPAEYTIEGWINITSAPANNNGEAIFDTGSGGSDPELNTFNNSGTLQLYESLSNNTNWDGDTLQTGRWYHFAQVVQGSSASDSSAVHKIYIDGKLSLTNTINLSGRSASSIACIGSRTNDTVYGNFYLSDLRFYQIAKYTSNFVVPSTSPDVLPDTPSGVAGGSKLTKITDGSVHFDGNGDYLEATSSTDFAFGTGDFTLEAYIYATSLPNTNNRIFCSGAGGSGDRTNFQLMVGSAGYLEFDNNTTYQTSNGVIGTNKWHHVAATREGTSLRLFADGRLLHTGTSSYDVTENGGVTIGREFGYSSYFNGYISNARILKGTALYTNDFTVPARTLTNVTNTKLLCCQSPTSATTATVASGTITANGNAAADNFNPFNTDINTVRGQETGYATLNPLNQSKDQQGVLSDGNLTFTRSGSGYASVVSTIGMTSGKWYCECTKTSTGTNTVIGVHNGNQIQNYLDKTSDGYGWRSDGVKVNNDTQGSNIGGYTNADVMSLAFDADNKALYFYKNNILLGSFTSITSSATPAEHYFAFSAYDGKSISVNFGQKPFKFPPPEGYQPLNNANTRPVNVISRPDQYVGVTTYSGTGDAVSSRTVELPFAADLVWAKSRDRTSGHQLIDTVRGNNLVLLSNSTTNDRNPVTQFSGGGISTIDGKTITIASGTSNNANLNTDGEGAVIWSWKAGGNKGTFNVDDVGYATAAAAGLPTESGGISVSACSVGTKQGFSIIKYGGGGNGENGIPHGLGRVPKFYIVKNIGSNSSYWTMYHVGMGNTKGIYFDTDGANTNDWWDNTTPTEDLFYVKQASLYVHNGTDDYISYLWCDVPGLQKFGTYEGNNNSNGPFVDLGFNPAIIWTKGIDSNSHGWEVHYNRGPSLRQNPQSERLMLDQNVVKATSNHVDFLSNGFKIRNTFSGMNNSTDTYIYCAWADVPSVNLYGGGANAR